MSEFYSDEEDFKKKGTKTNARDGTGFIAVGYENKLRDLAHITQGIDIKDIPTFSGVESVVGWDFPTIFPTITMSKNEFVNIQDVTIEEFVNTIKSLVDKIQILEAKLASLTKKDALQVQTIDLELEKAQAEYSELINRPTTNPNQEKIDLATAFNKLADELKEEKQNNRKLEEDYKELVKKSQEIQKDTNEQIKSLKERIDVLIESKTSTAKAPRRWIDEIVSELKE